MYLSTQEQKNAHTVYVKEDFVCIVVALFVCTCVSFN